MCVCVLVRVLATSVKNLATATKTLYAATLRTESLRDRHTANVGPGPVGPSFSVPTAHLGVPLALEGRLGEGGAVGTLDALRAPPVLTEDEVTTADRVRDLAVLTTQRVFLAWSQREREERYKRRIICYYALLEGNSKQSSGAV